MTEITLAVKYVDEPDKRPRYVRAAIQYIGQGRKLCLNYERGYARWVSLSHTDQTVDLAQAHVIYLTLRAEYPSSFEIRGVASDYTNGVSVAPPRESPPKQIQPIAMDTKPASEANELLTTAAVLERWPIIGNGKRLQNAVQRKKVVRGSTARGRLVVIDECFHAWVTALEPLPVQKPASAPAAPSKRRASRPPAPAPAAAAPLKPKSTVALDGLRGLVQEGLQLLVTGLAIPGHDITELEENLVQVLTAYEKEVSEHARYAEVVGKIVQALP